MVRNLKKGEERMKYFTAINKKDKAETISVSKEYSQEIIDKTMKERGYKILFGPYYSLKNTIKWTNEWNSR